MVQVTRSQVFCGCFCVVSQAFSCLPLQIRFLETNGSTNLRVLSTPSRLGYKGKRHQRQSGAAVGLSGTPQLMGQKVFSLPYYQQSSTSLLVTSTPDLYQNLGKRSIGQERQWCTAMEVTSSMLYVVTISWLDLLYYGY